MISRNIKYVRRLYYACPSEVAFVILDFFQRGAPESSENSDVLETDKDVDQSSDIHSEISNNDMRTIITKLSEKEPRLLLGILKSVIETIETMEDLENKGTVLKARCYVFKGTEVSSLHALFPKP
jgi:ribosomal biogenesis protein LAS1